MPSENRSALGTTLAIHIDVDDLKYRQTAAEILRLHDDFQVEATITSAVRCSRIVTGLVRSEEMVEEDPPSGASRRALGLTALDTFIEFKRRIGTSVGGEPNPSTPSRVSVTGFRKRHQRLVGELRG